MDIALEYMEYDGSMEIALVLFFIEIKNTPSSLNGGTSRNDFLENIFFLFF